MVPNDTIKALCRMAIEFEERGNVSMVTLLMESGYLKDPDRITEAHLADYFRDHPELIDTWLLQSMNKRTSPSWYFMASDDYSDHHKTWIVGLYPDGGIREFGDAADACGFYVKQEAEQIRHIIQRAG